jgi:hypothetical protein
VKVCLTAKHALGPFLRIRKWGEGASTERDHTIPSMDRWLLVTKSLVWCECNSRGPLEEFCLLNIFVRLHFVRFLKQCF